MISKYASVKVSTIFTASLELIVYFFGGILIVKLHNPIQYSYADQNDAILMLH